MRIIGAILRTGGVEDAQSRRDYRLGPSGSRPQAPAAPSNELGSSHFFEFRVAASSPDAQRRCGLAWRWFAPPPSPRPAALRLPPDGIAGCHGYASVAMPSARAQHAYAGTYLAWRSIILGWHGQTRLNVGSRIAKDARSSTVKQVWRCHPTLGVSRLHTYLCTAQA
jgi:hypothetical protein